MLKFFQRLLDRPEIIAKWSSIICAMIVLISISVIMPHWGLMDDADNAIAKVPAILSEGLLPFSYKYGVNDISWGMFRPLYPSLILLVYYPGTQLAPWVTFLWNATLALALLSLIAKYFARLQSVSFWFITLACANFFYLYDIFQHPSLQEKLVHLFGALLIISLRIQRPKVKFLCLSIWIALGVLSKASFVIYLAMASWVSFWDPAGEAFLKRARRALALGLITAFAVIFYSYIGRQGTYTSANFSLSKIPLNARSREGLLLISGLLAYVIFLVVKGAARAKPLTLTPAVGMISFLAIFLPWSVTGYIQTIVAPVAAVMVAVVVATLPKRMQVMAILAMSALGIATSAFRSYSIFTRNADLGRFVREGNTLQASGITQIYMPCAEGSESMKNFFKNAGAEKLDVVYLKGFESPYFLDGKYVFFDSSVCPLPNRAVGVEGCDAQVLFHPSFYKSYRLLKFTCKSGVSAPSVI